MLLMCSASLSPTGISRGQPVVPILASKSIKALFLSPESWILLISISLVFACSIPFLLICFSSSGFKPNTRHFLHAFLHDSTLSWLDLKLKVKIPQFHGYERPVSLSGHLSREIRNLLLLTPNEKQGVGYCRCDANRVEFGRKPAESMRRRGGTR